MYAQFYGASAVDGNINDSNFGSIAKAANPRFVQVAAKFSFEESMQPIKEHQPMGVSELERLEILLRSLLADSSLVNGLSLLERQALKNSSQIVESMPSVERRHR